MTRAEMEPDIADLHTEAETRSALPRWRAVEFAMPLVHWDTSVLLSWESARSFSAAVEQARRTIVRNHRARALERITLDLDAGKRSRLRRVIADWDAYSTPVVDEESHRASGRSGVFWTRLSDLEPDEFAGYLEVAHHHPAVARGWGSGARQWFEDWRHYALGALANGLSAGAVVGIVNSRPRGRAVFHRLALGRPRPLNLDRLRERLANTIFPNAPAASRSPRRLVCGGGRVAT